jgi:hypothetical protein
MNETAHAPQETKVAPITGGALAKAAQLYRTAGLRCPPVPPELAESLAGHAEWQFGTEVVDLTDRDDFLAAARDPASPAQVAFGHVGYGIANWWLCYRLILAPLAVFARHSFGGVYADHEASLRSINPNVEQVGELIALSDVAVHTGRLLPGRRLVLLLDPLGGSGWEIAGGADGWHDSNQPLDDVMRSWGAAA